MMRVQQVVDLYLRRPPQLWSAPRCLGCLDMLPESPASRLQRRWFRLPSGHWVCGDCRTVTNTEGN